MYLLWKIFRLVVCWLVIGMSLTSIQAQNRPSLEGSFPHEGSKDILRNAFISLKLKLPNGDLDFRTVNTDHVKLYPSDNPGELIPIFLTLSNSLNSLILEPYGMLAANTLYTVELSDGIKDEKGKTFIPVSFQFETGEQGFRKLITMNRPFGDKPEDGSWQETDVSGEDLSTPFLREATPLAAAPKVEEPPKLLKPERSRDELLRLVLWLYGGAKTPRGFGPTVLKTPPIPPLPLAALRETTLDMDQLIAMAADTTAADDPELVVDRKAEIQTKWLMADLDQVSLKNEVSALGLPTARYPRRIGKRPPLVSQTEIEDLLAEANQDLIDAFKQEQLARVEEVKIAEAEKVDIQPEKLAISIEKTTAPNEKAELLPPHAELPSQLALQKSKVSEEEIYELISKANQELIEAEQQTVEQAVEAKQEPIAEAKPQEPIAEVKPQESHTQIAPLLVEETIRNQAKAGRISFPQTAIFLNEYVTVEFDLPQREFVSFVLRDIKGDVYRTEGGYVEAGTHKRAVTLEGIPPGAYEAVVETIHQKVVRKVTILE